MIKLAILSALIATALATKTSDFQADHTIFTLYNAPEALTTVYWRTCVRNSGGFDCPLAGNWETMREIYLPSTNETSYGTTLTTYKVCEHTVGSRGLHFLGISCPGGTTVRAIMNLITDPTGWPASFVEDDVSWWRVDFISYYPDGNSVFEDLIMPSRDTQPAGYIPRVAFSAYWKPICCH